MDLESEFRSLVRDLRSEMKEKFHRHVSLQDLLFDRWETAKFYGFGEGASCYNNVLILGDVNVGKNTWIGPNVILDGSGGLQIGEFCSVSANVQIYSHDTVRWATSGGVEAFEYEKTKIGKNCYLGPNVIIQKGVTIGDACIIGANSFVNSNVQSNTTVTGNPAKPVR